ncbi:hypothetical protein COO60DRAFT_1517835 [Scenedesmus sp. NREL 46B-D3]|nr:hypothetical protein COO60DRAFT_1517835 [Scenedesmus sp. NREL 46B-D3]
MLLLTLLMLAESSGPASAKGDSRALKATVPASSVDKCTLITSPAEELPAAAARAVLRGHQYRILPRPSRLQPARGSERERTRQRVPVALCSSVHASIGE